MDSTFGDLRAWMNRPTINSEQRRALLSLILNMAKEHPHQYAQIWRPYLLGFPHHFKEVMAHFKSLNMLQRAHDALPWALFGFRFKSLQYTQNHRELNALLTSPACVCIAALRITGHDIDPATIQTLTTHTLPNLISLEVVHHKFGKKGVQALRNWPTMAQLESLRLRHTSLGTYDIRTIMSAEGLHDNLRVLSLSGNRMSRDGHLNPLMRLPHLRELNLSHNRLSARTAEHLKQWLPGCTTLSSLNLSHNHLGISCSPPNLLELAHASAVKSLTHLNLSANSLQADNIEAIASWPALSSVQDLNISNNSIGDIEVQALIQSEHLGGLTSLNLSNNRLRAKSIRALANWPGLTSLMTLDVRGNALHKDDHQPLLNSSRLNPHTTLKL